MNETPWHAASWRAMLTELLPRLLSDRLPLVGYGADVRDDGALLTVCVGAPGAPAEADYAVPVPDPNGVFVVDGIERVVPPRASSDDLDTAEITCAGEQFATFVAARLVPSPDPGEWDEETLRGLVPIGEWARAFLCGAQRWDRTNRLAELVHLRRIILPEGCRPFAPGHMGRVCPAETPENENLGRVLTVARGATISDRRLIVLDDAPEASLGPSAASLPLLQHIDPARALMACNLMRQWLVPPDPEPALVQTGLEPADSSFWCGRNLLTAYVSMGIDTYEDSLLVSESAARRLSYPGPVEAGDKLSNRSGNKGVIARIAPDDEMPRLADGTPVELCMSPNSIYSRMTFGQLREAVLSWTARTRGEPIVFGPLSAPTADETARLVAEAGLPSSGMRVLTDARTGRPFEQPVTVGWVYWGKLLQTAARGYFASAPLTPRSQKWGEAEFNALRLAGANAVIESVFGVQASDSPCAADLPGLLRAARAERPTAVMPCFERLRRRLARAGIRAEVRPEGVAYSFADPVTGAGGAAAEGMLRLAAPVPHPWLPERELTRVGAAGRMPAYLDLVRANARAERMLRPAAPDTLRAAAVADLAEALRAYLDAMVRPSALRVNGRHEQSGRLAFSARAVATPGACLRHDEVGIPDTMARELLQPLLEGSADDDALDALMARTWVLLHRHPTTGPSSILALHPKRVPGRVLRIHPMACLTLNADFDGDILGIVLPLTHAAQEEAGRVLTLAAQIALDRRGDRCSRPVYEALFGPLARQVRPAQDSRFGLARLCMTPAGRAEVEELAGVPVRLDRDMLTTDGICRMLDEALDAYGPEGMLEAASRLWYRGLEACRDLGPSLTPFPGAPCELPGKPSADDPDVWAAYQDECSARIMTGYWDRVGDTDPARVTLLSGARGTARMWTVGVGVRGLVRDASGGTAIVRHATSEGLTPEETLLTFVGMRHGLRGSMYWVDMQKEMASSGLQAGYGVLERALRSHRPGIVFARAAAAGEVDPLDTPRSRLLVGRSV